MIDLFLYEHIARTRLRQGCVEDGSGGFYYRMGEGRGAVRLSASEWEWVEGRFREEIALTAKALKLAIWMTIPFGLLLVVIIASIPPLQAALSAFDRVVPLLLPFLITSALPLGMMAQHMLAVQHAVDRSRARLQSRPRCTVPPGTGRRRGLNTLELVALVAVGPHLVFEIYGSINPAGFRNTPFSGTHLDLWGLTGIAVLVLMAALRWREARKASPASPASAPAQHAPAAAAPVRGRQGFGRRV
jgi:hypothetical protein